MQNRRSLRVDGRHEWAEKRAGKSGVWRAILLHRLVLLCVLFGAWAAPAWARIEERSIHVARDVDVPTTVQGSGGRGTIVWMPSELGVTRNERVAAARLAAMGYRVWLPDFYTAHFLPPLQSSMAQVPDKDLRALFAVAHDGSAPFYLVASGSGAARALASAPPNTRGAVLFFPDLLTGSPAAGDDPVYLPVAAQVRLPLAILQGDRSPWYWQIDTLKSRLEQGGAQLRIEILHGMRDRFFYREDALPAERELGAKLAALVDEAIRHLPKPKEVEK
jgi:dienelactone hydrolase